MDVVVAQALNENSDATHPSGGPRKRDVAALEKLERLSADVNKSWPEDKRFHFEVLDLPPALLVKMPYRNRATFSFFASFQDREDRKRTDRWQAVGAINDHKVETGGNGYDGLDLLPLRRGPSKKPRFLAAFGFVSCGSGVGVSYYAYEWHPEPTGDLDEFIKLEGAVSRFDPSQEPGGFKQPQKDSDDAFLPVGKFQTQGPIISLPYCWYSAIDTWHNPSLCAVNSYDISGDHVRYAGTVFNRPDLLPIAKAIEYAQARDYPAVLAYCGSPDVAQRMVRDTPPFVWAGTELQIKRTGPQRRHVETPTAEFDVEKRGDRWLVVAFRMD